MTRKIAHTDDTTPLTLDDLDAELIHLIPRNAAVRNGDLAAALGVSEATVRRRRKRLEQLELIRYYALPNARRLGLMDVLMWVRVEPSKVLDAAYTLAASPRTRSVDVLGGRYDLFVTGYFSSSDDLLDFLTNTVAQLDGVIETETFQCLRTVKRHFLTWSREDAEPKVPGSGV